ncbi:unnamed protein product [Prunus armeniaca]
MDSPPGCKMWPNTSNMVCKLRKSLYGLKQSPRAWFGKFSKSIKDFGYKQITGNDPVEKAALQHHLASEFEMKDLGALKMLANKPADTPMELNHQLGEYPDQVPTNKEIYQCLVGKLIYLGHTRPDIAYAVSVVNQFMHTSSEAHMDAELGFKPKYAMQLNCDNKAAIDIAYNPVQHNRTKHVEVDRHFIKEKLEAKIIKVSFVKSEDQLADVLTKAITGRVFHSSLSKLGIDDIYIPT